MEMQQGLIKRDHAYQLGQWHGGVVAPGNVHKAGFSSDLEGKGTSNSIALHWFILFSCSIVCQT